MGIALPSVSEHSRLALPLIYLRTISSNLLIYQPVFIPFLLSRGLNMVDVALLQTAYNLGVLALDLPAGYLADRFGRKWALALCNTCLAIGTALIFLGHSLSAFLVAELFYACAIALDSGVHSAYLYEWLRRRGEERQYYRYDALGTFLVLVIGAIGTFAAGYLAEQELGLPIAITIGLTAIGIPAAIFLPAIGVSPPRRTEEEPAASGAAKAGAGLSRPGKLAPIESITSMSPPAIRNARGGGNFRVIENAMAGVTRLVTQVFGTPGLRWALAVTVIWFWSRQYINFMISPPYFKSIGLELRHFGMLYAMMTLTSGVIALASRRLMQRPDLRPITILGILLIPTSLALMGLVPGKAGLAGFFLFAIPYGLCTSVTNTLLNRQFTRHDQRATFLSFVDLCVRLVSSILAILLGWVLARQGAAPALIVAAALSGIVVLALFPGSLRYASEPMAPSTKK